MLFVIYGVGVAAGIGFVFVRYPVFLLEPISKFPTTVDPL